MNAFLRITDIAALIGGIKGGVHKMTTKLLKPVRCRQNRRGLYQRFLPIAYLALVSCVAPGADAVKFVHTAEFGEVSFYGPKDSPQGFVVLFSGEDGINEQDHIAITRLVDSGMLVAAINARPTLRILGQATAHQSCVDLSLSLERLSHNAQANWKFTRYYEPILLGRNAGGTLVYTALAQAPASTFAGGVSVDLSVSLKLARKLCALNTISVGPDEQRVAAGYRLGGWWRVAGTHPLTPEVMAFAEAAVGANPSSAVQIGEPKTLARLYVDAVGTPLRGVSQGNAETGAIESLPLVEVSSDESDDTLAIVFSGSSGWREIDRYLVETLKDEGIAVLGVDTFRYFWSKRTPEGVAQDLARVITHYGTIWHVERVVLIGYSFGANILPFAYNGLASEVQKKITMIALLAPQRFASFEIVGYGGSTRKPNPVTLAIEPEDNPSLTLAVHLTTTPAACPGPTAAVTMNRLFAADQHLTRTTSE